MDMMDYINLVNKPVGSLAFGGMAAAVFGHSIKAWRVGRSSRTWPSVEGEVTSARAVPANEHYVVKFVCQYVVGGETFFHQDTLLDRWDTLAVASEKAREREGRRMKVYYNPNEPGHAEFNPGETGGAMFLMGIAAALLGVALALIWHWWRN